MEKTNSPLLKNKHYDLLKWLSLIVLPAVGTLYFGLSGIWDLPYGEQVVGTIVVLVTFLGVLLGVSSKTYAEETVGNIEITEPNGEDMSQTVYFNLNRDLDNLPAGRPVRFSVSRDDS